MIIEIWHDQSSYGKEGWNLKMNETQMNRTRWKKEKLIKVINTIIEAIEE